MKILDSIKTKQALVGAGLLSLMVTANAAVPESVTSAIDAAKSDGVEVGWLVVGVIAALFVFSIIKRLLR